MKKKKWTLIFGTVIICLVLLFSIPNGVSAEQKGKVNLAIGWSSFGMRGIDPHTNGGSAGMPLVSTVFEGLVLYASDGNHYPNLAKSWTIEPNWKYVTFNLDEKATWTDGKPVTAADVKFSFERCMRKENELRFVWRSEFRRKVDRVEVVDDNTARVHLKSAYPALMDRASKEFVIVPKHYVEKVGDKEFQLKPLGSGSFRCEKLQQDVFANMTARKTHHRKVPAFKELKILYVQEPATRIAMLQTGEVDMATLNTQHIETVENNPNLRVVWSRDINIRTLLFVALADPNYKGPLKDIRVRKAIAYAIDYEAIAKHVFKGTVTPTWNIVAPYHPGHDPSKKHHPYDPEKAKKLLAEAGYPNGFSTILTGSHNYKNDAQAVQASLSKIGINAKMGALEHGTWRKHLQHKKLKGMAIHPTPYWNGRKHTSTALASTFDTGSKYTYHDDKEMEKEWVTLSTMISEEDQAKVVRKLTKLYHEKMYRINLWSIARGYGVSKKIKYFKNPPGRSFPVGLEYLTLNQ